MILFFSRLEAAHFGNLDRRPRSVTENVINISKFSKTSLDQD